MTHVILNKRQFVLEDTKMFLSLGLGLLLFPFLNPLPACSVT